MSFYKRQLLGGFWQINQPLARHFKCKDTVLVLDELIFHESKHADKDGWFYYNTDDLAEKCLIGEKLRRSCFQRLKDSKILEIERKGIPYRFYFKINGDAIDCLIKERPLTTKDATIDRPEEGNIDRPEEGNVYIYKEDINKKEQQRERTSEEVVVVGNPFSRNKENPCKVFEASFDPSTDKIKAYLIGLGLVFNKMDCARIGIFFGSLDKLQEYIEDFLTDETFVELPKQRIQKILAANLKKMIET